MNLFKKILDINLNLNFNFLSNKKRILIYTYKTNSVNFDFIKKNFRHKFIFSFVNDYNLFIFLLALIKSIFSKEKFFIHNYLEFLIRFGNIKVIISDLDNYYYLLSLKKKIRSIKILLIQNATRGHKTDIFKNFLKYNEYKVDDFIVFNDCIKIKYQKYVKAKYHVLGSLRLNDFLDKFKFKKKTENLKIFFTYLNTKKVWKKELFLGISLY